MADVRADDDTIQRFVVMHYRYDPDRRERRNVVVAAFDNEAEFQARVTSLAADLRTRRESDDPPDVREHISGVVLEPGHHALQRNARLLLRAVRHGAASGTIRNLSIPAHLALLSAEHEDGSD